MELVMRRTIKAKVTARPATSRNIKVTTSVSGNGVTKTRSKTIRLK